MNGHRISLGLVATLCFSLTATHAAADRLGAAIVGGIIGGVIVNEVNKNQRKTTTTTRNVQPRSTGTVNTAAREQNRQVQTSLNYFGFPAGGADGVLGQRSRAAIAQYQAHLGFPATGQLTPYERDFLVSSYNRAQIGGPQVIRVEHQPARRQRLAGGLAQRGDGRRRAIAGGQLWRDAARGFRRRRRDRSQCRADSRAVAATLGLYPTG